MNTLLNRIAAAALTVAVLIVAGCEEVQETASTTSTTVAPPPVVEGSSGGITTIVSDSPVAPPIVAEQPPVTATTTNNGTTTTTGGDNTPATISPPNPDTTNRTVAEVGVGRKGRYDSNDYVSTVVGAYFGIQQRLAFDQAKRGLNDYKTLNGDYPKTHEQYWKEVIEENLISLPELPDGEEYYYDYEAAKSTRGEEALFVVQPRP